MKLYQYTILKQDGTKEVLKPCKKKTLKELYQILNCQMVEIIPNAYYEGLGHGHCTMWGDEEARFNPENYRNPHFKVLKGNIALEEEREWDVVGNIIKEEIYKGNK
jgi:hypothetical protein